MTTVYIVTYGEYSAYEIGGVYVTLKAAREHAGSPLSSQIYDSTTIQEWVLGSDGIRSEPAQDRGRRRGVAFTASAHFVEQFGGRRKTLVVNEKEHPHNFAHFDPDIWIDRKGARVVVYAVDRERGLKAFRDAVAQLRAEQEGVA